MLRVELLYELPVSPTLAFAYLAAPARMPEWQGNLASVSVAPDPPLRLGSRLTERRRAPVGGREAKEVREVVGFELGQRLDLLVVDGPIPIEVDHLLAPGATPDTCHLEVVAHARLPYPFRFAQPLFKRTLRRQLEADYARLVERLQALGRRNP
jgi:hypothetical protein